MPVSRMHPRTPSLRRLRTAFRSASPSPSRSSIHSDISRSPISPRRFLAGFSGVLSEKPSTSSSSASMGSSRQFSMRPLFLPMGIRRQPSLIDVEMEEERRSFPAELEMLEPRPAGVVVGSIFEIMDGRI